MEVRSWNGYWRCQQAWFLVGWHVWKLHFFFGGGGGAKPESVCVVKHQNSWNIQNWGFVFNNAWNMCPLKSVKWRSPPQQKPSKTLASIYSRGFRGSQETTMGSICVEELWGAIRLEWCRLARQTPSLWRPKIGGKNGSSGVGGVDELIPLIWAMKKTLVVYGI